MKAHCAHANERCWYCKADGNGEVLHYKPTSARAPKHPLRVQEALDKKQAKDSIKRAASKKRLDDAANNVFDERKHRGKLAVKAEARTEKVLTVIARRAFERKAVRSSDGNSGRVANDDDHVLLGGYLRLDTKNQSKRMNPEVTLADYDECKAKAIKHGSEAFGLVVVNKEGRSFVCFDLEQDWPQLNVALLDYFFPSPEGSPR